MRSRVATAKLVPPRSGGAPLGATALRAVRFCASLLGATLLGSTFLGTPLLSGCGGAAQTAAYRNPDFHRGTTSLVPLAIAPVPFTGPLADRFDSALDRAFMDSPGMMLMLQATVFRQRLNGDHDMLVLVNQIAAARYATQELASANLARTLSPKQMVDLQKATSSAKMLFVPAEVDVQAQAAKTSGRALYHIYDLETGKLLLQNSVQVSVPEGGDAGARGAVVELVLAMQKDVAKQLL